MGSGAASFAASAPATLRECAAQKNLLVGTAGSSKQLTDPNVADLISKQANILVAENAMKWQHIHPSQDRFDFTGGDSLLRFASEHRQAVRGHNLCWHNQLPVWFQERATSSNAADLLRSHIAAVAGRYAGRIQSWDVVNEAVRVEDGRPDGLRNSIWLRLLGPQYLEIAFRAAFEADPHALLTYNDYDLEQDSPLHARKRRSVLQLLTSLRERDIPIHALGLQSHLKAGATIPDWSNLLRFLEQVEKLKLQIFITELDVDDSKLPAPAAQRDRVVGALYEDYLKHVLKRDSVKAILTWGISDAGTWLNSFNPRKDSLPQRPLPFDGELQPKPAFFAMRSAILQCRSRHADQLKAVSTFLRRS